MRLKALIALAGALLCALPALAQIGGGVTNPPTIITATGGIAARAIADRFAEWVDVKDFGAKCDGSTDDYTAISAAASRASSGNVKAVYFPPSATACLISQKVTVPTGVTFWAMPGTVTLKPTSGNVSSPELLAFANSAANATVYGLTFDGGGADFANANTVVQAFGGSGLVLDTVTVQHAHGIGALFSTSITNSGVRNSIFSDVGNHWKTTLVSTDRQQAISFCCGTTANNYGNFVTGSYFSDVGLDAISATLQTNFLAANNRFSLSNNQINLVTATAYAAAIYAANDTAATATGNVVEGASGNGIDFFTVTDALITSNYVNLSGSAGISVATVTNATVTGNVTLNNVQWASASPKGGISLGGANGAITVAGNVSTDTQGSKTQGYGVHGYSSASFTSLWIDQSNNLAGNLTAAAGGSNVTGYTMFRNGVIAQSPDSTSTGGNARGSLATDLQISRSSANQVASGASSTISGGASNQAAGQYGTVAGGVANFASAFASFAEGQSAVSTNSYAVAMGFTVTADGQYAQARGGQVTTRNRWGADCFAAGFLAVQGDAQRCTHTLRGTGASTSAIRLTADQAAAGANNCVSIPNNTGYALTVTVMAFDHTTVTKNEAWHNWALLLTRGANAASTAIVAGTTPTPLTNGTVTGSAIAATADTTNGCLNLSFTPPTSNTDTWNVVARVESIEVQ